MKRAREVTGVSVASPPQQGHPVNLFALEPLPASAPLPPPTLLSLAELQSLPRPFTPSGLRLALEGQNRYQSQKQSDPLLSSSSSVSSSLLSALPAEEFAARISRHKDEIEQYLHAQVPSKSSLLSLVLDGKKIVKVGLFFFCGRESNCGGRWRRSIKSTTGPY